MAYKKKLEFHLGAALLTILEFHELFAKLKGNYSNEDEDFYNSIAQTNQANKFFVSDVRTILRNDIEKSPEMLASYKANLERVKSNETKEFSLTIKGSGTKSQIIEELRGWITSIEQTSIEELVEGVDLEERNSTMQTNEPYQ